MLYNEFIKKIKAKDKKNVEYLLNYYLNENEKLNKIKISLLKILYLKIKIIKSRKKPLQYIIGNVNFYGYKYKINKNVLIPRFETEELVEKTIAMIKDKYRGKRISIIDICTGSGCIGLTLKRELNNVDVTITDLSKKALRIAKTNAKNLDIEIICTNILAGIEKKYDVIIANPPYISEKEEIMDIVKNNEPKMALYAKNDGLYFYEEILKNCRKNLKENYIIALEIGNNQANAIKDIINKHLKNTDIVVMKDLSDKDRMIFITEKH